MWSLTRKMVCKYLFSIRWIVDIQRERVVGGGSEPNNNISLWARVGKGELIGGACESVLSIRAKTILLSWPTPVTTLLERRNSSREPSVSPHHPPAITLETTDLKQWGDQPRNGDVHYCLYRSFRSSREMELNTEQRTKDLNYPEWRNCWVQPCFSLVMSRMSWDNR